MITAPGVYDISAEEYFADPCSRPSLHASLAKLLVQPGSTPLHAWSECPPLNPDYEREDDEKFDLGKAAHALMLRDMSQAFEIVDAKDWKTKAAQDARDRGREAGKIPLLAWRLAEVQAMVDAGRRQLAVHEEAADAFTDGLVEQTLIWEESGLLCRARLDWKPNRSALYPDYKSTGASADAELWQKTMYGMGADLQAAFYIRGIRKLGLHSRPQFRFIVQENYKPFALNVIGLMPGALDLADREIDKALQIWRACLDSNRWPAYPRKTSFIDAPAWHEAAILNREVRNEEASMADKRRAVEMQAPV